MASDSSLVMFLSRFQALNCFLYWRSLVKCQSRPYSQESTRSYLAKNLCSLAMTSATLDSGMSCLQYRSVMASLCLAKSGLGVADGVGFARAERGGTRRGRAMMAGEVGAICDQDRHQRSMTRLQGEDGRLEIRAAWQ